MASRGSAAAEEVIYDYPSEGGNQCPRCGVNFVDHISYKTHLQAHGIKNFKYRCRKCKLLGETLFALSSHFVHCKKRDASSQEKFRSRTLSASQIPTSNPVHSESSDSDSEFSKLLDAALLTRQALHTQETNDSSDDEVDLKCRWCRRCFQTARGRGVHEQAMHTAEYEASQQLPTKIRWSDAEINIMAEAEAKLGPATRFINVELKKILPLRAIESIKKQRSYTAYKELVKKCLDNLNQIVEVDELSDGDSIPIPDDPTQSLDISAISSQLEPISATAQFIAYFEEAARSNHAGVKRLANAILQDTNFNISSINEFLPRANKTADSRISNTQDPKGSGFTKAPVRRLVRYKVFKRNQKLFKFNKKKLMQEILNGDGSGVPHPTVHDINNVFGELFSRESKEDEEAFSLRERKCDTYIPIKKVDVLHAIRRCRSSTPGPDGVTLTHIKNSNADLLALLMNAFLYFKDIPTSLKVSRTVLLPKKGDLTSAKNWRPITIGPILVRIFHSILARRFLTAIDLHFSQQAFQCFDGISANVSLVDHIISEARRRKSDVYMASIDVAKAFDSVSHHSINRALKAAGLEEDMISYIRNSYINCSTEICCADIKTDTVRVLNGVKQGDPLSPVLFNCVIDELARSIPSYIGFPVEHYKCNIICFADDILLIASSRMGMKILLQTLERFLEKRGLKANPAKCSILGLKKLGKQKKVISDTHFKFMLYNEKLNQITYDKLLTYLGLNYSPKGKCRPNIGKVITEIKLLNDSQLKPHQKLSLLRDYLIPRHLHELTLSYMQKQDLITLDTKIKNVVRAWLRLPHYTPEGFFFSKLRDGGLGLISFRVKGPIHALNRIKNLANNPSPIVQAMRSLPHTERSVTRLLKILGHEIDPNKDSAVRYWRDRLHDTVYGHGLAQSIDCNRSNDFLLNLDNFKSPRNLINLIKLRLNLLPCKGAPSNRGGRQCRAGCNKVESLSHICNSCPSTKSEIIKRHDKIIALIKNSRRNMRPKIYIEPRIRTADAQLYKPDLILEDEEKSLITVCDIAVPWETPLDLTQNYNLKVTKYSNESFKAALRLLYPGKDIKICAFIVSARGVWCKKNNDICDYLGLGVGWQKLACKVALEQSLNVYNSFMDRFHH